MADDEMLKSHQETFKGFVKISIYSTVFVIIVLAGMALFLV